MSAWNAKIDYKIIKKDNDEKLFIQLQIDEFKINEQINEPQFKLRLSRHEQLFTNETTYFLNTFLNNNENNDINCLFSGKNRRISLVLNGCTRFSGYLIIQNHVYSLTPLDEANYRVQMIEDQVFSKCKYDNYIPAVVQYSKQNHLKQLNVNINLQKSLIYSLNNDINALFYNLIQNFHISSTYFNTVYDLKLTIESINLVDMHTNKYMMLQDLKANTTKPHSDALNVFIVDEKANNDCYMIKSNACDLSTNKVLLKYDQNTLAMSNNIIKTILNLINKADCMPKNDFHILDMAANDDVDLKKCFIGSNYCSTPTATCGNGIIEDNEDCDCGFNNNGNCDTNCCNAKTCKFQKDDYECSQGACCNKCKLSKAGQVCRSKNDDECDIEEKCDGQSSVCPTDVYVHDGTSCENNGVCYSGTCANADSQCKLIWNESSVSSDSSCYKNFNTIGFQSGNCVSSVTAEGSTKYDACSSDDALCGLLNCQFGRDKPQIPTESFFKSTTTMKDKQFECKVITNTSNAELMYVRDGTRCSSNKICVNRKCTQMPQLKCPISSVNKKLCSGNGVCNSELKCMCNERWTGSACDYYLSDNNDAFNNNNQTLKLDFNKATLNTTSLLSIIAGFILIFLFIFVFIFLCQRRRRVRSLSASIDKLESFQEPSHQTTTIYIDNDNKPNFLQDDFTTNGSIKFGSLPSYKEYKLKNKSKTSLSAATQQPTPTKISNTSMLSCSDNISITKVNHAIKQLSVQPNKSILKKQPNDNQLEYYEEIQNLNDTYTNTHLNAQYLTISKRESLTLSTSSSSGSSSSSSSLSPTLNVPAEVELDDDIDGINIELNTKNHQIEQPLFLNEANFQNKVQDYLNELNILSKQNNFASASNTLDETSLLITPIKPIFSCENIILNTNNSETSSGYVSSSTSNQNNIVQESTARNTGGLIQKCINNNSNNESIIYDVEESQQEMSRINDKRYSYILATASTNNLSLDPE